MGRRSAAASSCSAKFNDKKREQSLHLARVAEDTEMGLVSTSQANQGVVKEPWVIVMFIKIKMMVATW